MLRSTMPLSKSSRFRNLSGLDLKATMALTLQNLHWSSLTRTIHSPSPSLGGIQTKPSSTLRQQALSSSPSTSVSERSCLSLQTDDFHLNTTNYTRTVSLTAISSGMQQTDFGSYGTEMLTVLRQEPTCTEPTPSTSTTVVRTALTVSSSPALRAWTSKSTTPMGNFSSTTPLEASSICTS
jgi:hypothetical protein